MIRNNLSTLMGARRLKISEVSTATGITRQTLTTLYYERGRGIAYDTLETLCRYLGIQPGDLLYMTEDEAQSK